jgi:hypothetical protein
LLEKTILIFLFLFISGVLPLLLIIIFLNEFENISLFAIEISSSISLWLSDIFFILIGTIFLWLFSFLINLYLYLFEILSFLLFSYFELCFIISLDLLLFKINFFFWLIILFGLGDSFELLNIIWTWLAFFLFISSALSCL